MLRGVLESCCLILRVQFDYSWPDSGALGDGNRILADTAL